MEKPNQSPPLDKEQKELLFKHYQVLIDAYKHYLEMVLKLIVFHSAITGAILSYYLSQKNEGVMRYALIFPIVMSLVFAAFAFFGSCRVFYISDEVKRVTILLDFDGYPDPNFLKHALRIAGGLFILIAIGLIIVSFAR